MAKKRHDLERVEEGPIYGVFLDAGAFTWLHEILQAKTRNQRWIPEYQALVHRALVSFDDAARAQDVESGKSPVVTPEPEPQRHRTVPRKVKRR